MRVLVMLTVAALALMVLPMPGFAGDDCELTMWVQAPDLQDGRDFESQWDADGAGLDIIKADDWINLDGFPIAGVRWWGSYIDNEQFEPNGFHINMYGNNDMGTPGDSGDDVPGDLQRAYWFSLAETHESFFGTDGAGEDVYMYWVSLGSSWPDWFEQKLNDKYWLSIVADAIDGGSFPTWGWHSSTGLEGVPGLSTAVTGKVRDGSLCAEGDPAQWEHLDHDMSFVLVTNWCIPEPSTFAMLGMGIAGLVCFRRRRR
jgi:hypothetical protein